MSATSTIGALLKRLARTRSGLALGVAIGSTGLTLLVSGVLWARSTYRANLAAAEQRGRNDEREKARLLITGYVFTIAPALARRDTIIMRTDSVLRSHNRTARDAAAAIANVPQAVRESSPVVDVALTAAERLVADTAAISKAVMTERIAHLDVHARDSAAIHALASQVVTWTDSTMLARKETQKRPRWSTVAKVGGTLFGAGVVVGKWVLPALIKRDDP